MVVLIIYRRGKQLRFRDEVCRSLCNHLKSVQVFEVNEVIPSLLEVFSSLRKRFRQNEFSHSEFKLKSLKSVVSPLKYIISLNVKSSDNL